MTNDTPADTPADTPVSSASGLLAGRRLVITGGGSGIGRATARLCAAAGAQIILVDRNEEGVAESARLADPSGTTVVPMTGDVGTERDTLAMVAACQQRFGGIDGLFANAGVSGGRVPLFEQSVDYWQEVLRVNLIGAFLSVKAAIGPMQAAGYGSIVCTASVAGLRANAGGTPYSASKAGVISLVQTVANEFFGQGIRINAVCPGLIETGMTKPLFDRARERGSEHKIGQLNPQNRYGVPDDIGKAVRFLLSDEASYVNGQAIAVDGGLSSTHPFVKGSTAPAPGGKAEAL